MKIAILGEIHKDGLNFLSSEKFEIVYVQNFEEDNIESSFQKNNDKTLGSWKILIIGDAVHAFGDGVLIASAFVADIRLGVLATISVLTHEIPHHIGDIAVVYQSIRSKSKSISRVSFAR